MAGSGTVTVFLVAVGMLGQAVVAAPGLGLLEAPVAGTGHERLLPQPPGTEVELELRYGPFLIAPGANSNRIHADVQPHEGFLTYFAPALVDADTSKEPGHLLHLHHAHWLRPARDGEPTYSAGLAWVFGTGGEATVGDVDARSAAEPGGPRYGIHLRSAEPFELVYMVHNFGKEPAKLYLLVKARFVYGSAEQVRAAGGCPGATAALGCAAGQEFRALQGRIWGATFDVPREAEGDDSYTHPPDEPLGMMFTAARDGTAIGAAGHLHENGKEVVLANLGPEGSACEQDLDGDGWPGITVLRSRKVDRDPATWPTSHDYQMEVTPPAWRAPVRAGDRITQFGVYANQLHATYTAMSYVGMYTDLAQAPPARGEEGCTLANTRAALVGGAESDSAAGVLSQPWKEDHGHNCGPGMHHECEEPQERPEPGPAASQVLITDFTFRDGDRSLQGAEALPPLVAKGASLRFVSLDAAAGIRHAVTSCAWPCNGEVASNYPQSDGRFDSGRLGNLDALDRALSGGKETAPVWETPKDLEPGVYTYFCRMHPFMRGWFVVEGEGLPEEPEHPHQEPAPVSPAQAPARGAPGPELAFALAALAGAALVWARRRAH